MRLIIACISIVQIVLLFVIYSGVNTRIDYLENELLSLMDHFQVVREEVIINEARCVARYQHIIEELENGGTKKRTFF